MYARANWSIDRLHPSELGHRVVAHRFAAALREAGHPVPRLPGLTPTNPEPTAGERLWWMATRGNRWLLRRSTDLLPTLARMAAAEWWHGVRENEADPNWDSLVSEEFPGQVEYGGEFA